MNTLLKEAQPMEPEVSPASKLLSEVLSLRKKIYTILNGWEDQPRAPEGTPNGGQWVSSGISGNDEFKKRAVFEFSKSGNSAINDYLNGVSSGSINELEKNLSSRFGEDVRIDDVVSGIDKYLKENSPGKELVTYRGLNFYGKPDDGSDPFTGAYSGKDAENKYNAFKEKMRVGSTFTEKGYTSSSLNEKYAERFTKADVGSTKPMKIFSAFLKIIDDQGVDITNNSFHKFDPPAGYNYILHPRNSTYEVVEVNEEVINGMDKESSLGAPFQKLYDSKRLNVTIRRKKPVFKVRNFGVIYNYNEDQPRAPAGTSEGGQWVSDGSTVTSEQEGSAAMSKHKKRLTGDNKESINRYTETGYQKVNQHLRFDVKIEPNGQTAELIKNLDQFFDSNPPKYEGMTYRGMGLISPEYQDFMESVKVGGVLQDKGYLSTSTSIDFAQNFDSLSSNFIFFKIKGKGGVYLNGLAAEPSEKEVLFRRGSKFRIVSISEEKEKKIPFEGFGKYYNYATIVLEEI